MSVYKKRNGKWYCQFMVKGERIHKLLDGATGLESAKELELAERFKLRQIQNGLRPREEKKHSFKELTNTFLRYSETNKADYKNDKHKVDVILNYFGNNAEAENILPEKIEAFKQEMLKKYSKAYVNRYLACLKTIFSLGVKNNKIKTNPMKQVSMLVEDNYKIRYLTAEEEERLFKELPDYLKPIVICALQTGLRKSNILNLTWEQIDFDFGFIEILRQQNKGRKVIKIPISEKLMQVFNKLPKVSEFVFYNPDTGKNYKCIDEGFNNACKRAGVNNFTFHDLRHTVATRLVEKNIDIVVVKEIMAHSSIATTQRYMHPTPKRKMEAINVLNSYN